MIIVLHPGDVVSDIKCFMRGAIAVDVIVHGGWEYGFLLEVNDESWSNWEDGDTKRFFGDMPDFKMSNMAQHANMTIEVTRVGNT